MSRVFHPRPNPIVAAMYTARDMDVDVVVIHGPAGCSFMASRPLENAGVHVVTSSMKDKDLIFGGTSSLEATLKDVIDRFSPKTIAVIGTCASTIIGDDIDAVISRFKFKDTICFSIDCHGCLESNTDGAIRTVIAGAKAGIISKEEADRQTVLLKAATDLEKKRGMAGKSYLSPAISPTKLSVCKEIIDTLSSGGKVAVAMVAKKELAFRFADMFIAVNQVKKICGGETFLIGNLDEKKGLPRIRQYCVDIIDDLKANDVVLNECVGGLDEYAIVGERMQSSIDSFNPDLLIILGICHSFPKIDKNAILITDQPRQLKNYLEEGYKAVGEVGSHSMVMGKNKIVTLETAQTLRELI